MGAMAELTQQAVPLFVDRALLVSCEILGMSPRTVQNHLQHIYETLGVETRTAAVMRALGK